jgi:hypothetical protein
MQAPGLQALAGPEPACLPIDEEVMNISPIMRRLAVYR